MIRRKCYLSVCARYYSSLVVSGRVAVVKIPAYVNRHIEITKFREKRKLLQRAPVAPTLFKGNTKFPVISSNNKHLNFYLGQRWDARYRVPLISRHWMKKSTAGEKFTIHKVNSDFLWQTCSDDVRYLPLKFSEFNLESKVMLALDERKLEKPSPIQSLAIPKIIEGKNILCVDVPGSGKTMAYVIPILNQLIRKKAKRTRTVPNSPLAVVVVPGRELAEQIGLEAYNICEPCGIDVRVLCSKGAKHSHLIPKDDENVDFLIATFGTLSKLIQRNIFDLSRLRHLVLDEVDTLLDDSFLEETLQFLQFVMNDNCPHDISERVQLILSSATCPSNIFELHEALPNEVIENVIQRKAYNLKSNIDHKFLRLGHLHRAGTLLELVKKDLQKPAPVIIFANQSPCCDWLVSFLESNNVHCQKLHAGMGKRERAVAFFSFQNGEVDVICCTDVLSRGLDTKRAEHVINFDFPNNMSDYILRSGRVGRLGSKHGHVTNFITTVPGAAVVQEIERAVRTSSFLPYVDSNIKRKLRTLHRHYDK